MSEKNLHPSEHSEREAFQALAVTNILLGLLAAGIFLGFVYVRFIYRPELDPQQAARYAAEAKERLAKHSDAISEEAAALAQETLPPLSKAFYKQAREDYPVYVSVLQSQGDEYLANVEQILRDELKEQYKDYLRVHREVLRQEFPKHASDKNVDLVLHDFENTMNGLAERYYLDEFRRQSERTAALWKEVEPLDPPGPNEPSLTEQLADYTADWTVLAATESAEEELSADSEPRLADRPSRAANDLAPTDTESPATTTRESDKE